MMICMYTGSFHLKKKSIFHSREWLQRINALNNAGQYPRAMDLVSAKNNFQSQEEKK